MRARHNISNFSLLVNINEGTFQTDPDGAELAGARHDIALQAIVGQTD